MKKHLILISSVLLLLALMSCGGGSEAPAEAPQETETVSGDPQSIGEAMKKVEQAVEQMNEGNTTEVIDFRVLKALLPEQLIGMERVAHAGEKAGAMGFVVSNAEAEYEDGDRRLEVKIVDTGGIMGLTMGMAAWATVEVDRENQDGFERTTTIDGHKAFESYNSNNRSGELNLLVSDRIVVTLEGRNLESDALRSALEQLDLDSLEGI